jgi:hypothetical protein
VIDQTQAHANPELAVLSAIAHGHDANVERAVEIALAAQNASIDLDSDRSRVYRDLIFHSLSEAARQALGQMDARTYEFQSDFARHCIARGRAEGIAKCAALVIRQLTLRFGELDAHTQARIQGASIELLTAVGERVLAARTLQEALEPLASADPRA